MSGTKWVPSDHVDEICPAPRDTPDDWIVRADDGAPMLIGWTGGEEPDDGDGGPRLLVDGEIVEFTSVAEHGEALLTFNGDATWTLDRDMPAAANTAWLRDDPYAVAESVQALIDSLEGEIETGEHVVGFSEWGSGTAYRFDATACRFVAVEGGTQ